MARVYISSTFEDLREYRAVAAEACRKLGHVATGMEEHGAKDIYGIEKAWSEVRYADIYLGIIGWRYGHISAGLNNPENLSITHLEYREASGEGKPCLIFMMHPNLSDSDSSDRERVDQFRRELQASRLVQYFNSIEEFQHLVIMGLATMKELATIESGTAIETHSQEKPKSSSIEAFLSYNSSSSREAVRAIADRLMRDGIRVWMDDISLKAGDEWSKVTRDALSRAATIIAFVGPSGVGPSQQPEIDQALSRLAQDARFRLIPVLLPESDPNTVPLGLKRFRWIRFPSLHDRDAYISLLSAIRTGDHPAPQPTTEETLSDAAPESVPAERVEHAHVDEVPLSDADLKLITDVLFRVAARLRERPENLSSLDGPTFWAQVQKIAPQTSTLEDLRRLNEELGRVPGPGPLWSAWVGNTRRAELEALMRNASPREVPAL